jgi:hypothetical protein
VSSLINIWKGGILLNVESRVATFISEKGLKRCAVANRAGIKPARFNLILNLKTEMTADEFESTCTALEVPPDKFLIYPKKTSH